MIADTQVFIDRFKGTASKAVQVQSRIRSLDKMPLIDVDEEDNSALRLKFPPSPRSGSYPVTVEGLSKSYDNHNVFSNASFTIERGERVAFVGKKW